MAPGDADIRGSIVPGRIGRRHRNDKRAEPGGYRRRGWERKVPAVMVSGENIV